MGEDISHNLGLITEKLDETLKRFDAKELGEAMMPIDDLMHSIKNMVNKELRNPAEKLVTKLKQDEDLTSEDLEIIKKWLIGDSESYTRIENNLIDWVAECKRILEILDYYKEDSLEGNENKLLALGALLTDLKFTLIDVQRYSKAMNEVDKLKSMAYGGKPTAETKNKIAEMIQKKLYSE